MKHGTLSGYKHHGCRCVPCHAAERRYETSRKRAHGYGSWEPLVPVEEVQPILSDWRAAGITWVEISRVTGVDISAIHKAAFGRQSSITPATALAIKTARPDLTARSYLPAAGTVRRIRGLQHAGWTTTDIAKEARMSKNALQKALRNPTVTAATAAKVAAAARVLLNQPSPNRPQNNSVRNMAARKGWMPLLAWDDIDDPDETPNLGAPNPGRGHRPFADLHDDVTHLAAAGCNREEIAARTGLTWNNVTLAYRRHNTPLPLNLRSTAA